MRKFVFALICLGCLFGLVQAQDSANVSCYAKGQKNVQVGIGLGAIGGYGTLSLPPLSVGLDYAASELISIGGSIGFYGSSYSEAGSEWSYSYFPIIIRAAFHPFNLESLKKSVAIRNKLDAYGGLTLGYTLVNSSVSGADVPGYTAGNSYVDWGLLIGARWYFSPKTAIFLEEGSGFAWISLGVSFKM